MRHLALLLVPVILIAGCLGGGGGSENSFTLTPNDGLSISFQPTSSSFLSDETVRLQMEVENTGQYDAEITGASIFGASFLVEGCSTTSDVTGTTLAGVVKAGELAGQQASIIWTCGSPASVNGAEEQFDAGIDVEYTYETDASASLTLIPRDRFSSASSVSTDNTAAPVHAEVTANSPIPVVEGTQSYSVPITLRNVGDGEVAGLVDMTVAAPNAPSGVSLSGCGGTYDLFEGSRDVVCQLSVSNPDVVQESQFTLRIALSYTYRERRQSSFTVRSLS